jgi:hypothetical protein
MNLKPPQSLKMLRRRPGLPFTLPSRLVLTLLCLGFIGNRAWGPVISVVDSPPDDLAALGDCSSYYDRLDIQAPAREYNDLIDEHFSPLKQADVAAIFGPKLDPPPLDRARPLFAPTMIGELGMAPSGPLNKAHVDFHAIGAVGYLKVHYQWDGETPNSCILYLRVDDQFVPLKSTNDIPKRLAWDESRFAMLRQWLDAHLPKLTDLGVVEVSRSGPTRIDLGAGTACIVTTRDISTANVPYWLSLVIVKETANPQEDKFWQDKSVSQPDKPVVFSMDGKFYRFTPKLVSQLSAPNERQRSAGP